MKERFCCGQSKKKIRPISVSAPLHLILRAPAPASHEWKSVPVKRLCQVCHLQVDQGVRCRSCGLKVHPQCTSNFDKLDTNLLKKTGSDERREVGSSFSNQQQDRHHKSHLQTQQDSIFYKQFEPRIKKIAESEERSGASSSVRFSSCGDSVAASTQIVLGTVSIETPRSESKTPEITVTPGSAAVEAGTEIEARLLSSSASELPDSGCAGLLDEEDDETTTTRGESSQAESHWRGQGQQESKSGHLSSSQHKKGLLHVDGPIDGSPYAVLVKQKPFADSGIPFSVDQMKDLDALVQALVEEAESIDIPYHARTDSLPFSYTSPQSITSHAEKRQYRSQQEPQTSASTTYSAVDGSTRVNNYSNNIVTSPSPVYATPDPYPKRNTHNNSTTTERNRYDYSSLDQQILNPQPSGLSRSISHQPQQSYSNYGTSQPTTSHMHGSMSSNNFNNVGNGSLISSGGGRRNRSQSADGRGHNDFERDEGADEWLARQMKKLQAKKASKHVVRNDWLQELKRALPQTERSQSQTDYSQSQEFRPSQISRIERIMEQGPVTPVSTSTTPIATGRGNIPYSSDDDDDVEMEMFQRGRRVQRHFSESAYDRGYTSSTGSTRAPSQQSYTETPFPICPPTPYTNRPLSPGKPPRSPKAIRKYQGGSSAPIGVVNVVTSRMDRAQTPVNPRPVYMGDSQVKFAQDISEFWYKPFASREETVNTLMQSPPGTFIIRNSNSFPGAFGLALVNDSNGEKGIRHFLIEPTRFGVRLRGCGTLEPVFGSLSALVYAHSIECLALPTKLSLPSFDILPSSQSQSTTAHLLRQGAACQLLFLGMIGVECLSGEEAINRGMSEISATSPVPISLRLSKSGLTLTDVFRKMFFRIHFSLHEIQHASVIIGKSVAYGREIKQVFAIVARAPRATENSVIVLAELEQGQPANAIVSFIQRVLAWQQH